MSIIALDTSGIAGVQGLTDAHLARRKNYITASDMPAICGVDQYRNAYDVWAEKTGIAEPREAGEAALIGNALEPAIGEMAARALGRPLTKRGSWNTKGVMGATLDFILADTRDEIVQCKSRGVAASREYLENGPPLRDVIQVHAEMICADAQAAFLAALLATPGPLTFRLYRIERDPQLCTLLEEHASAFWSLVQARRAPDSCGSVETYKRIVRRQGAVARVSDEAMRKYTNARRARIDAEKEVESIKDIEDRCLSEILREMGDAEVAESGLGVLSARVISCKERVQKAYSYTRLDFKPAKEVPNEER